MSGASIIEGDCREVMDGMPEDTYDAIVCDPPYGLEFMGKDWDRLDGALAEHRTRRDTSAMQQWHLSWTVEAFRVLKPGGHLVAFGGSRTFHRLACAIEDAGFEVRDCLSWLYGSGFPKSSDVSKSIDKLAGAEREIVGRGDGGLHHRANVTNLANWDTDHDAVGHAVTAPATIEAQLWQGWGTALKPAWEPIILARKPFRGSVARNVLDHGTGALNIDGTRIGDEVRFNPPTNSANAYGGFEMCDGEGTTVAGRWPANVVLDEQAAVALDEQTGERGGGYGVRGADSASAVIYGGGKGMQRTDSGQVVGYGDAGGASRFFYTSKSSTSERQERVKQAGQRNTHPTVKPVDLMRWLVRLITPPGGLVLDPFAGSGTTMVAALKEGCDSVGIEREAEYVAIARARIDGVQQGFEW